MIFRGTISTAPKRPEWTDAPIVILALYVLALAAAAIFA